jgi:membrane associated rhomboid family serine protease
MSSSQGRRRQGVTGQDEDRFNQVWNEDDDVALALYLSNQPNDCEVVYQTQSWSEPSRPPPSLLQAAAARHAADWKKERRSQREAAHPAAPQPTESVSSSATTPGEAQAVTAATTATRRSKKQGMQELIQTLGHAKHLPLLPPELQQRVRDFRGARRQRRQTNSSSQYGVFGLYSALAEIRLDLEWAEDAAYRRQCGLPYLRWQDFVQMQKRSNWRRLDHESWWRRCMSHQNRLFTYSLIFVCTVMMIVTIGMNGWQLAPVSVNPLLGPNAETLVRAGARSTGLIVYQAQWYRVFTPLILHAGLAHWFINMLALYFIGAAIEENHGSANCLVLFIIPGVGGNILSALFLPQYITVGASGGIFGLLGGCIADIGLNFRLLFIPEEDAEDAAMAAALAASVPHDAESRWAWFGRPGSLWCKCCKMSNQHRQYVSAISWLFLDIFVNVLFGLTPFVDNFCHLGGLLYGVMAGWSTLEPLAVEFFLESQASGTAAAATRKTPCCSWARTRHALTRYFGVIVSCLLILVSTVWLATASFGNTPLPSTTVSVSDGTTTTTTPAALSSPCPKCRYISCVPFPFWKDEKWWYCDDCDFVTANYYRQGETSSESLSVSTYYTRVELTCPNQREVESIDLSSLDHMRNISDATELDKKLPTLCRTYCDNVFA